VSETKFCFHPSLLLTRRSHRAEVGRRPKGNRASPGVRSPLPPRRDPSSTIRIPDQTSQSRRSTAVAATLRQRGPGRGEILQQRGRIPAAARSSSAGGAGDRRGRVPPTSRDRPRRVPVPRFGTTSRGTRIAASSRAPEQMQAGCAAVTSYQSRGLVEYTVRVASKLKHPASLSIT
jgi:hypothetical protein